MCYPADIAHAWVTQVVRWRERATALLNHWKHVLRCCPINASIACAWFKPQTPYQVIVKMRFACNDFRDAIVLVR